MPNSSTGRSSKKNLVLTALLFSSLATASLAAAPQQQPQAGSVREHRAPSDDADSILRTISSRQDAMHPADREKLSEHDRLTQPRGRDTPVYVPNIENDGAVATLAPAYDPVEERVSRGRAVRASQSARSAAGSRPDLSAERYDGLAGGRGVRAPRARSLQDWEVENLVLLATVDGAIYARKRDTGDEVWRFYSETSMVQTMYHRDNSSRRTPTSGGEEEGDDDDGFRDGYEDEHMTEVGILSKNREDDFMWIVEPSLDGALYLFDPHSEGGMKNLHLTVRQLAEELSPYASEDSQFVYTAEKRNTLYTLNATDGSALKFFSAGNSGVTTPGDKCKPLRRLESLEDEDDECEPTPTILLGRTEYTVGIQNGDTGAKICTIKYFEWTPNIRDRDLQAQYSFTMDKRYVYTRYDGSIMALEYKHHQTNKIEEGLRTPERLVYAKKFTHSPVAQVFDVARPVNADTRDATLVVLQQPVAPNTLNPTTDPLDNIDSIFINRTDHGSWYALSEMHYPSVTDGAARAKCYVPGEPSVLDGETDFWSNPIHGGCADLVGVHNLFAPSSGGSSGTGVPTIEGPRDLVGIIDYQPASEDPALAYNRTSPPNEKNSSWITPQVFFTVMSFLVVALAVALKDSSTISTLTSNIWAEKAKPSVLMPDNNITVTRVEPDNSRLAAKNAPLEVERKSVRFADADTDTENLLERTETQGTDPAADEADGTEARASPETAEDAAPDANGEGSPDTPKKKKAHRGTRGGRRRKKATKIAEDEADDSIEKVVEGVMQLNRDPGIQPDEISVGVEGVSDVGGTLQLNNLVVWKDKILGYGSGGTIVCEGTFEGRQVAIKRMLPQYYELALQEVSLLQQSDYHSNVIRYFCQQKDPNFLYIAVELCQASLFDLFKDGCGINGLNEQQLELKNQINLNVPAALYQLADGLNHLHSLRVIHRDIKPQNILIAHPKKTQTKGARLVISDFGLCKTLPDNQSTLGPTTGNAGTVGWKAPELISRPHSGEGRNSSTAEDSRNSTNSTEAITPGFKRSVDIFSLGCVFYYVLTNGAHPFESSDDSWSVMREVNIKKGLLDLSKLKNLGPDTEEPLQLIEWMLMPKPEDRPTAKQVMNHPFFWTPAKRLSFLCDVSDHWESLPRDPPSPHLQVLESYAPEVLKDAGNNFLSRLHRSFIDTLGKQRKYSGERLLDLLRALRNKKNHYADMPEEVRLKVGDLPDGYLKYWTGRFPSLLILCWMAVLECGLSRDQRFREYIEGLDRFSL
ncbi:hypothetical protein P152DRAFT_455184 [Eremomyces bilateralis CBS 781.70]|uniref:non-specific serine/threonine protein kinase n=1 Tax=Eremomyces bilateralis CBS 781.70 TaxID=1392243 RepID=A0A6G1GC44_9PEZI|nr:uncharacterized protein P152DRAFT_455184 [Eremomyces bilateralis CBS 781.70]KAF1815470.1 hypothetical protein P152DRAFT_455184 [Eremomyces bilateralis CBS 781.70]